MTQAPPPPPAPPQPPLPGVSGFRIFGGILLALFLFGIYAYLPYRIDSYLASRGLAPSYPPELLLVAGGFLAFLTALSFVAKPTRAWGPVRVLVYAVTIGYLLALLQSPFDRVHVGGATFTFGYGPVLELLLIPPALGLLYAILVTVGDYLHPEERIRKMFG